MATSVAFALAALIGILPDTTKNKSLIKIVFGRTMILCTLTALLIVHYQIIASRVTFSSFHKSLVSVITLYWTFTSCGSYVLFILQKPKILELIFDYQKLPRLREKQGVANIIFVGYVISLVAYSILEAAVVGHVYINHLFINSMALLMDAVFADVLLLHANITGAMVSKLHFVKKSGRLFRQMNNLELLRRISVRQDLLCQLYGKVTMIFAFSNLGSVTYCLMEVVFTLYYNIENQAPVSPMDGIFYVCFYMGKMAFVARATHALYVQEQKLANALIDLSCEGYRSLAINQIEYLQLQLLHLNSRQVDNGLVTIDFTLVCSVIGAIAQYIFVIEQFT